MIRSIRLPVRALQCGFVLAFRLGLPAQEAARDPGFANFVLKPTAKTTAQLSTPAPNRKSSQSGRKAQVQLSKEGPWGQIEYFTTQLEVPLDLLKLAEEQSLSLDWHFPGIAASEVEKLFRSIELPPAIETDVLETDEWRTEGGGTIVSPSAQTIEDLPPAARNTIYAVLARFPQNRFQFEPDIVPGGDVSDWLGRATLRPAILAAMQKMLHQRGHATVFSDTALILRMAQSDAERLAIRKALSRTPTLICKLRVGPESDAAKLAEYWSAGRRFKDIEPFLESMIATEGVTSIDLVQLLPAAVRKLLYTFPNESHGLAGYFPDCHWTSLNFFNYDPLQRLAEPPMATAYTIENYFEVPQADRLGDVLFLMDKKTGNAYHSCVYIADDIIYTKNGRSRVSPWVLMKLEDVRALYCIYQETTTVAYRLKPRL